MGAVCIQVEETALEKMRDTWVDPCLGGQAWGQPGLVGPLETQMLSRVQGSLVRLQGEEGTGLGWSVTTQRKGLDRSVWACSGSEISFAPHSHLEILSWRVEW